MPGGYGQFSTGKALDAAAPSGGLNDLFSKPAASGGGDFSFAGLGAVLGNVLGAAQGLYGYQMAAATGRAMRAQAIQQQQQINQTLVQQQAASKIAEQQVSLALQQTHERVRQQSFAGWSAKQFMGGFVSGAGADTWAIRQNQRNKEIEAEAAKANIIAGVRSEYNQIRSNLPNPVLAGFNEATQLFQAGGQVDVSLKQLDDLGRVSGFDQQMAKSREEISGLRYADAQQALATQQAITRDMEQQLATMKGRAALAGLARLFPFGLPSIYGPFGRRITAEDIATYEAP